MHMRPIMPDGSRCPSPAARSRRALVGTAVRLCAARRVSDLTQPQTGCALLALSLISVIISTSWGAVLPPPPDPMGWRSLTPSWPAHPYTPGESSSTGIAARAAWRDF